MLLATNWIVVRIPALIGDALNILESRGSEALLDAQHIALELAVLGAIVIVVRTLSRVLFFNPGRDIEYRLGLDLFAHLLSLQRPYYLRHKVGELVSLASNDTASVRLLVGFVLLQVGNVAVAVPMHLYQMLATDVVLTLWCLGPLVAGALYMRYAVRKFFTMVRQSMALLASLSDRVIECYGGIATIRSYAAEENAFAYFERLNREYLDLQLKVATLRAFGMPVLGFAGLIGTALTVWIGGERVIAGEMAIGDIATFSTLLVSLVAILTGLAWVLTAVSRGLVSLQRVDEVLESASDHPPAKTHVAIVEPPRVEVRDLSFRYPGATTYALDRIELTIEPGRTLGIFGKTGSGKTTLIELLTRVYTPPQSTIFFDGADASSVPLDELRRIMAVVPQSPFLFSMTLLDNIRLDAPHTNEADLERVLRATALHDDVAALPDGLETIVGERGVMLSGGQRQRASLARALYLERPLLILDDVLSAVDQGTEIKLVDAIRRLRTRGDHPPTTIIVSHRTSVLEHADEIVVLHSGRVTERGSHAALIVTGGEYAQAHRHQASERGSYSPSEQEQR